MCHVYKNDQKSSKETVATFEIVLQKIFNAFSTTNWIQEKVFVVCLTPTASILFVLICPVCLPRKESGGRAAPSQVVRVSESRVHYTHYTHKCLSQEIQRGNLRKGWDRE